MAGDPTAAGPSPDELEISIFGPGYGECIAVHLGAGEWLIVDSCIDSRTSRPAVLTYFEFIGVDAASAVRRIVATHWHDDHVRGLAEIVRSCPRGEFYCSAALQQNEFKVLVSLHGRDEDLLSGVSEFFEIQEELVARRTGSKPGVGQPHFALANRIVWQRDATAASPSGLVRALSPSDGSLRLAFESIAGLIPAIESMKRRIPRPSPNHASVVIWLEIGENIKVLFGADLESTAAEGTGWQAVIADDQCPSGGNVFKVPHHGSSNGHHAETWSKMLSGDPIAVVCPYRNGSVLLPTDLDIARIRRSSGEAYSTAKREPGHRRKRDSAVERTIRETVRRIKDSPGPIGQVRLRRRPSEMAWRVELIDGACELAVA